MSNKATIEGNTNPSEGPNAKEMAIFLRGLADGIEDGSLHSAGSEDSETVRTDPLEGRWLKNLLDAGVSPERTKELEKYVITVDVSVQEKDDGLMEMLEALFGPGSVVVEDHLRSEVMDSGQNAPSTNTPQ